MQRYADVLLDSMVSRDPGRLPLANRYTITENLTPGVAHMLSGWRTVSGVNQVGQYIVDEKAGQVFVTANVDEGGLPSMFWARIKVVDDEITEIESFKASARAHGGFVMQAEEVGNLPEAWTKPIPDDARATREELEHVGRAVYDSTLQAPPKADGCLLLELGGVVFVDADFNSLMQTGKFPEERREDKIPLSRGLPPIRPTDPRARVVAIDEEQGIVVVSGLLTGSVLPSLEPGLVESAFVPTELIHMHERTIIPEWAEGQKLINDVPALCASTHIVKIFGGEVQGVHLLNYVTGATSGEPWV